MNSYKHQSYKEVNHGKEHENLFKRADSGIPDLGISKAAKSVGIPWQTVRKWAKEAGLISADTGEANVETDVVSKIEEVKKAAAEKVEEAKDKIESAREATVPTEIEVKKAARKAGREMKKAADKAVDTVKRTAKKAKIANLAIIIQSPLGGNITVEEIADKVPDDADAVFVRVDQNKLWWTRGDEKGDVDIWE